MYHYESYSSSTIKDALIEKVNVIIPLGAVEAHSAHLPLATDNLIAQDYVMALAERTNSLLLPLLPFGQTWSLQFAPGSLHIEEETLVSFLEDILISLDRQGARMATLISTHVGNMTAMKAAARRVYEKIPLKVIYLTYPGLSKAKPIFENLTTHPLFIHADEIETSLLLHLHPDIVHMEKCQSGLIQVPKEVDYTPQRWTEFTDHYIIGDADKSSAQKGKAAFDVLVDEAATLILKEKKAIIYGKD